MIFIGGKDSIFLHISIEVGCWWGELRKPLEIWKVYINVRTSLKIIFIQLNMSK